MEENASSIGFRSGEYGGRYKSSAPDSRSGMWVVCGSTQRPYVPHSPSINSFTWGSW